MTTVLWDLRTLQPSYATRMQDAPARHDHFRSEAFLASVAAIERNPAERARLTIALLRHLALDPASGTTLDEHVPLRGSIFKNAAAGHDEVYFSLQFHRVCNFLGNFTLPASAPEVPALFKAIEDNLASRMFKAARLERRLQKNVPKCYGRFRRAAEAAYTAAYTAAETGAPAWKAFDNEERCRFYDQHVYPAARAASDAVEVPLQERLLQRLRAVAEATCDEAFRGSYTDLRIAFVERYLAPPTLH